MATYRNIQLSFWTDSKVADDFTPEDKYFYLYLLTNPHTNTCGCYEISMKQMSIELGYSTDTVERLINRFVTVHNIIRYSKENKEMLILNWRKYNWTTSEKLRISIYNAIKPIKTKQYKEYLLKCFENIDYDGELDAAFEDSNHPAEAIAEYDDVIPDLPDLTAEKKEKQRMHKAEVENFFESLWKIYIRKEGKSGVTQKAKEEIFKVGYERMAKCIQNYAKQKAGCDKQYILMGNTFFNGRYKDYLDKEESSYVVQHSSGQTRRTLQ